MDELAAGERINSSYVSRVMRLTLLAPDIVETILDGRQSEGVALPALMAPFPAEWTAQRAAFASATSILEGRRDPPRNRARRDPVRWAARLRPVLGRIRQVARRVRVVPGQALDEPALHEGRSAASSASAVSFGYTSRPETRTAKARMCFRRFAGSSSVAFVHR
ncbi:hypothetical protein ACFQU2_18680 [Siccirubricoccus deserti]